ncbi:unnamed protein product, partial [Rotaria socialis]
QIDSPNATFKSICEASQNYQLGGTLGELIKNFFHHIEILHITTASSYSYLHAKTWEEITQSSMPKLRIFDIINEDAIETKNLVHYFSLLPFTFTFWTQKNGLYSSQEEIDFKPVEHVYICNRNAIYHCNGYFPNATELTIKHSFHLHYNSIMKVVPLNKLNKLSIECYDFPVEQILHLVNFTKKIRFMANLFPQVESLKIGVVRKEVLNIIRYLLTEKFHLSFLCIKQISKTFVRQFDNKCRKGNMARFNSITRFLSRRDQRSEKSISVVSTPDTPPTMNTLNETDHEYFAPSIDQQKNGVKLQKKLNSMLLEFIEMQKRHAREDREWSTKWETYFQSNRFASECFTTTVKLVTATTCIGNEIADKLTSTNHTLRRNARAVTDTHQYPSLKEQLQNESRLLSKFADELNKLKRQKNELENDLKSIHLQLTRKNLDRPEETKLKTQQRTKKRELQQLKQQIELSEEDHTEAKQKYDENKEALLKKSQENELARLQLFTDPLKKFFNTLKIENTEFSDALNSHSPDKDLNKWRETLRSSSLHSSDKR